MHSHVAHAKKHRIFYKIKRNAYFLNIQNTEYSKNATQSNFPKCIYVLFIYTDTASTRKCNNHRFQTPDPPFRHDYCM
jgi:hypothetical protein